MNVKVLGTRQLDFKTDNGQVVRGTQIFVCYPYQNVNGYLTDKIFVSADSPVKLPVFKFGEEYVFNYSGIGRRQFLTEIVPVG